MELPSLEAMLASGPNDPLEWLLGGKPSMNLDTVPSLGLDAIF